MDKNDRLTAKIVLFQEMDSFLSEINGHHWEMFFLKIKLNFQITSLLISKKIFMY